MTVTGPQHGSMAPIPRLRCIVRYAAGESTQPRHGPTAATRGLTDRAGGNVMSASAPPNSAAHSEPHAPEVFGPVRAGGGEPTLPGAEEIESFAACLQANTPPQGTAVLFPAIAKHIQ